MLPELNNLTNKKINEKHIDISEFPNPIFRRKDYSLLDGNWDFRFDPNDIGIKQRWYKKFPKKNDRILVPYVYQSKKSNIFRETQSEDDRDIVWYNRKIDMDERQVRTILKFGAIDYYAKIYINGDFIGSHKGGFTPFSFEITNYLIQGENDIVIRVEDYLYREDILRGKQFWEKNSKSIWYTQSTGIWQSVWLEYVGEAYVDKFKITPNLDEGNFKFEINSKNIIKKNKYKLCVKILMKKQEIATFDISAKRNNIFTINVLGDNIFNYNYHEPGLVWSPENPSLFDVEISLIDNENEKIVDFIETYTAMRKIHTENGIVYLNNRPYYQRLVLDQGYWPDSLMTGKSLDHLKDILLAKKLGFNGARKHEKLESSHYYYWADVMGFIVWAEMPSAIMYSEKMATQSIQEWSEAIESLYNHPSILAWVPLNESWGISNIYQDKKHLNHSLTMYHYLKSIDQSRVIVNNDGWEINKTDIVAVHNYIHGDPQEKNVRRNYKKMFTNKDKFLASLPANRNIILEDYIEENYNKPILLTEFGGISFTNDSTKKNWGYSSVLNRETYLRELSDLFKTVVKAEFIQGYCYTQLYDVEQETNGLLTYDRKLKVDYDEINKIVNYHKTIFKIY